VSTERGRGDAIWISTVALTFALGLAATWERWGGPLVDTGREMNQPLRLMSGERLYSDVRHIYGPLSPWLNAALFRIFSPSLSVLYANGIVSAALVLALVYWLARRVMDPDAAGIATLTVEWLCVFKPAGNYILPYSYNALHGTVLGLATLAFLTWMLQRGRASYGPFAVAGLLASAALLAKTEIGIAAIAASAFAAVQSESGYGGIERAGVFVVAALLPTIGVYAAIASHVGWRTLLVDSWMLPSALPPELVYYNRHIAGFDEPVRWAARVLLAAVKIGILAAIVVAMSWLAASGRQRRRAWILLAAAVALAAILGITTGLDWDKGPYLAMPVLLVFLFVSGTREVRLYSVFAFVCLLRMVLRVRSGGAYGSFLIPVSIVLFTYLWIGPFADLVPDLRARAVFRRISLALLLVAALATAALVVHRYRALYTSPIATSRGTMLAEPALAQAWNEALEFIARTTKPGDAVAVMPEGTSLDFFSGRRNPLREEITTPGYLSGQLEDRAIRQLRDARTALILITDRRTPEFGPAVFGRDYCRRLMQWIDANYTSCATFGGAFSIRAYCGSH
jgi:dolichyl-phosphate-mannose-protein mannosyltransferase